MPTQETDTTTIETEKQIIKKVAGLSSTKEIIFNDRGWDSRVYSFGSGRYFFKFPRSEKIQGRYKYEIAALKFLSNIDTNILVQKILWEHPENSYFGYEGVQGNPVNEIIEELSIKQKQSIGKALGDFLKQFHKSRIQDSRIRTLEDEARQIQHWYENSNSTITKWFSKIEQQRLHHLVYEVWPAKLIELGSEPVLSHCDLHFENVLYSHDDRVGIIDFGDIAYCDRSKDFLELDNDKTIFDSVLNAYKSYDDQLIKKIAVRQAMIQIINLGFYVGKGDIVNTKSTVDKIRLTLAS